MSSNLVSDALREFDASLDDLHSNLEFVRTASRVRPRLNEMLRWEALDPESRTLASSFLKQRTADETTLYKGMVVSLSGAFEQFIHRLIKDCVTTVNTAELKYEQIDEDLRKENFFRSGAAIQTIHEPLAYLEMNYELLARNLATCHRDSERFILNADAFPVFISVGSVANLEKALRRVKVNLDWDLIGDSRQVQSALTLGGTRETAKASAAFIEDFGKKRNRIAHSGSGGVVVSFEDLHLMVTFFRAFAKALVKNVNSDLQKTVTKSRRT